MHRCHFSPAMLEGHLRPRTVRVQSGVMPIAPNSEQQTATPFTRTFLWPASRKTQKSRSRAFWPGDQFRVQSVQRSVELRIGHFQAAHLLHDGGRVPAGHALHMHLGDRQLHGLFAALPLIELG